MSNRTRPQNRIAFQFCCKFRSFASEKRGSIAILFAFLLIPMIGAVGLAIDYSRLLALRSTAQTAADGAALLAVSVAKEESQAADSSTRGGDALRAERRRAEALRVARKRGKDFFDSYADGLAVGKANATVEVERNGQQLTARVDFAVTLPTTLGRVLGHNTMRGESTSGTLASLPLHYDIHLMLDISQSMGLGATRQDMIALFDATEAAGKTGCAFGCHVPQHEDFTTTNSQIARDNNVRMRIDVLRDAVGDLVTQAQAAMDIEGRYRVSLNTFSNDFRELARMTSDLRSVLSASRRIDLGPNRTPGYSDTEYDRHFPKLTRKISTNTDGLTQATALQFVFIITDGVRNMTGGCGPFGHCTAPISEQLCQNYKDKGATVGVIYTTYLPINSDPRDPNSPLDYRYTDMISPIADQIAPALQRCASPGWFFEATYENDIRAALAKLFEQVTAPPTLTD